MPVEKTHQHQGNAIFIDYKNQVSDTGSEGPLVIHRIQ